MWRCLLPTVVMLVRTETVIGPRRRTGRRQHDLTCKLLGQGFRLKHRERKIRCQGIAACNGVSDRARRHRQRRIGRRRAVEPMNHDIIRSCIRIHRCAESGGGRCVRGDNEARRASSRSDVVLLADLREPIRRTGDVRDLHFVFALFYLHINATVGTHDSNILVMLHYDAQRSRSAGAQKAIRRVEMLIQEAAFIASIRTSWRAWKISGSSSDDITPRSGTET